MFKCICCWLWTGICTVGICCRYSYQRKFSIDKARLEKNEQQMWWICHLSNVSLRKQTYKKTYGVSLHSVIPSPHPFLTIRVEPLKFLKNQNHRSGEGQDFLVNMEGVSHIGGVVWGIREALLSVNDVWIL